MNIEQKEATLVDALTVAFKEHPLAKDWLDKVSQYFSDIDDVVDGDKPPAAIIAIAFAGFEVFNHPYWLQNRVVLTPILVNASITYADTVAWEKETGWKKSYAKALRHAGQDLHRYILYHILGYEAVAKLSPLLREVTYERHKNDPEFLDKPDPEI